MKSRLLNRTWISPITSVTFLVVGVTGILMAFHVKNGGIKALHEWIGYAFTLAAVIHLVVNWRSFLSHFRERSAILAVCGGIILSLAVLYAGAGSGGKQGRPDQFVQTFDLNGNGRIDADEVSAAADSLNRLDGNHDGAISAQELVSTGGQGRGGNARGPRGPRGNPVRGNTL